MEGRTIEVKVGIFVFIGLLVLSLMIFSVGEFYFMRQGYQLRVLYDFASGVNVAAPVRLAGVTVGEVRGIRLFDDPETHRTRVSVNVWLDQNVQIRDDAKVYINTLGLLGEKYIEILDSGSSDRPVLASGSRLEGVDPVPMESLTRKGNQIAEELLIAVGALNKVIGPSESQQQLRETLANLSVLTRDIKEITAKINSGEGTLGKLVHRSHLYDNLEEFSDDVKRNPWKLLRKTQEKPKEGQSKR